MLNDNDNDNWTQRSRSSKLILRIIYFVSLLLSVYVELTGWCFWNSAVFFSLCFHSFFKRIKLFINTELLHAHNAYCTLINLHQNLWQRKSHMIQQKDMFRKQFLRSFICSICWRILFLFYFILFLKLSLKLVCNWRWIWIANRHSKIIFLSSKINKTVDLIGLIWKIDCVKHASCFQVNSDAKFPFRPNLLIIREFWRQCQFQRSKHFRTIGFFHKIIFLGWRLSIQAKI